MWKKIKGYEKYEVCTDGRIRNVNGKVLKPGITDGYYTVVLRSNGIGKTLRSHRIVAKEFIEGEFDGSEVNHKNGVKTDNRLENLEWVTRSENVRHAIRLGLKKPSIGSKNGNSVLDEQKVGLIKALREQGKSQREIGLMIGASQQAVSTVLTGKRWQHCS